MGSSTRFRASSTLEDTASILPTKNPSDIVETGNLFKDDSLAADALPLDESGDRNTYTLSHRNGPRSMLYHWLNEERREGTADWLVPLMYEAGSNDNALETHSGSVAVLLRDIEAAFYRSVFYRRPNPSSKGMVDTSPSGKGMVNPTTSSKGMVNPTTPSKGMVNPTPSRKGMVDQTPSSKDMVDPTPRAKSLPSLSDGSSCGDNKHIEEDMLDVLIQRLYRSLYFNGASGYRTCTNNTSGKGTASSKTNTSSQQPGQKRGNSGSNEHTPDDEQNGKSRKAKRTKMDRPNLKEFTTLFACPLCKGNIMFGYERGCRDWKNRCIDTVLRRHLATHVEIDHISQEDFDKVQVKELKKTFRFALEGKPEDLWVAAFMILFDYAETDRHKVPSPYWTTQGNVGNIPLYPDFHTNMRQRLTQDRAVPFEVTQYFRENDALATRRRERREELVRKFKAIGQGRLEQAQRQTDDEFQTAEQVMNLEFDKQQSILDQRYQMRWGISGHSSRVIQDKVPPTYRDTAQPSPPPQQPPATALQSPPPPGNGFGFSNYDMQPANMPTADDMWTHFVDSPQTPPAPVDPALLGNNVEVLHPSSVSPSAAERDDKSSFEDSGIGLCNSELPCSKDYVCDHHKPFHTVAP